MRLFSILSYYIRKNVHDPGFEPPTPRAALWNILAIGIIDLFYFFLATFTYLFLFFTAATFFLDWGTHYPLFVELIDAFSEPYLGFVGIYVILKEFRKRRQKIQSRHFGEAFVLAWIVLLILAVLFTVVSPRFSYNEVLRLIIINSLAVALLYIGSFYK